MSDPGDTDMGRTHPHNFHYLPVALLSPPILNLFSEVMKMSNRKKTYDPDFEANPEFEQDPGFLEWICQRVRNEAAGNPNEIDTEPDLENFEPSEELYERMVKEAHERGLLKED